MTHWGADLTLTAIVIAVAAIAQQGGTVKAGVRVLIVVFGGLIATCGFEPLAALAVRSAGSGGAAEKYALFSSLMGLFVASVMLLGFFARKLLPEPADLSPPIDGLGRWVFGGLSGVVTALFLFTAVHTFPGPKDFWGFLPPKPEDRRGPILATAPEEYWLRFVGHVSVNSLDRTDGRSFPDGDSADTANSFVTRYAKWRETQ